MTTATSLPDLYDRVQKACMSALVPRIRHDWNPHGPKRVKSWRNTNDFRLDDAEAEAIILASCVRWLADNDIETSVYPREGSDPYVVHVDEYGEDGSAGFHKNDSLTIAALLAVEAVCKERGQ